MFTRYTQDKLPTAEPVKITVYKQKQYVYPIPAAFDIETTNEPESQTAYMYHWQFAIDRAVFAGRTWDDFFLFLNFITQPALYSLGNLYVFIHNMDFEMSFLIGQLYVRGLIKRVFAKSEHEPLEVELYNGIIFRDSSALTSMSLASLAKNYTKTQKMIGDLDYTKMRNSTTPLTEKEKQYCINDVIILSEYAEQLHQEYTLNGLRIPMTSTGIVRTYIKEQIPTDKRYCIQAQVREMFPPSEAAYKYIMENLFRGGYTHAQTGACDQILKNVCSYDFTSAYPSIMIHEYFPNTPFRKVINPTEQKIIRLISQGRAVIFIAEFDNIVATTPHCIESKNKIDKSSLVHGIFENGRLYCAEHIQVMLTDVDYEIYQNFYKWDKMTIKEAITAQKGRLPDYLYHSVLRFYKDKKELKAKVKVAEAAGIDTSDLKKQLQKTKGMLNSCYGMCVSRLNFGEYHYGEHIDKESGETSVGWYQDEGKTYQELIKNQFLSPYWGIYITAYCRRNILRAIKYFGSYAIYSDTDSIKLLNTAPNLKEYFDEYNEKIRARNRLICERYHYDPAIYDDLGIFDYEGEYTRAKFLGAKRYIYEKDGHAEAVIAGLPKSVTEEYQKNYGITTMFRKFRQGMYFEYSDKNAHKYSGECSAVIYGELMHELGSCYIYEVSFKMCIDTLFMSQIVERKDEFKHDTKI